MEKLTIKLRNLDLLASCQAIAKEGRRPALKKILVETRIISQGREEADHHYTLTRLVATDGWILSVFTEPENKENMAFFKENKCEKFAFLLDPEKITIDKKAIWCELSLECTNEILPAGFVFGGGSHTVIEAKTDDPYSIHYTTTGAVHKVQKTYRLTYALSDGKSQVCAITPSEEQYPSWIDAFPKRLDTKHVAASVDMYGMAVEEDDVFEPSHAQFDTAILVRLQKISDIADKSKNGHVPQIFTRGLSAAVVIFPSLDRFVGVIMPLRMLLDDHLTKANERLYSIHHSKEA